MHSQSSFYQNSIFWVDVDKIKPNPYQPRREFDPVALQALSDSIKQYGVLQALVVTRKEIVREDGLVVEYELIAGERRLRASKLAGLSQVPVLIRIGEEEKKDDELLKLELAIIENVQREDLNPVERARAFKKLADDFGFKHNQIAQKVGKSRVYVSNTMRILELPNEMLDALSEGKINEGHTRPLLMLADRAEEQLVLFKDIILRKMNVRDAETAARRIAIDKVRRFKSDIDPEVTDLEEKFEDSLGTRVRIEKREEGGRMILDFFSYDDLEALLAIVESGKKGALQPFAKDISSVEKISFDGEVSGTEESSGKVSVENDGLEEELIDDRSQDEIKKAEDTPIPTIEEVAKEEEDLYSIKNFSI